MGDSSTINQLGSFASIISLGLSLIGNVIQFLFFISRKEAIKREKLKCALNRTMGIILDIDFSYHQHNKQLFIMKIPEFLQVEPVIVKNFRMLSWDHDDVKDFKQCLLALSDCAFVIQAGGIPASASITRSSHGLKILSNRALETLS